MNKLVKSNPNKNSNILLNRIEERLNITFTINTIKSVAPVINNISISLFFEYIAEYIKINPTNIINDIIIIAIKFVRLLLVYFINNTNKKHIVNSLVKCGYN